ncbi:type II and III secretion system protein family protein [Allopontixanthobacter sp.]|uniref:type II and III secretion system protein family protein n=1 Tax=Allopontixanthobacter sp. TaxID=2906452 RepID=UPI002ABC71CC|nr:type II and III secretion system protein family protein [Allopontixanthobacter sp.]MDZ4307000.1 type II and III secretion system protein family protein [Allopontixanthobacter sp.]
MGGTKVMQRITHLCLPFALLAAPVPVAAQYISSDIHAGTVEVPLNKSQVVNSDVVIDKAMVGNAEIADILPLTDRSVYVLGKSMGTTSLTLYDRGGRVIAVMDIAVGPDIHAFQDQVTRLIPGSDIKAHISGSSMVLTGLATDAGMIDRSVQLARSFAGENVVNLIGMGSSQQVMLEVRFAEVRRNIGENIGVRGFVSDGSFQGVTGPGSSLTPDPLDGTGLLKLGSITNGFGIISDSFRALGLDFEAYLDALETKGFAKTLAEPTLVALSGEKASFLAGGEFPIPVVQGGSTGGAAGGGGGGSSITVEFKPFGVSLAFTPTVLGDRTINLKVEPEVSSIDAAASIQLNGINIPGLQTRRASTTLELRDGESFAIAGLLQKEFQTTINQVPLLGSIPILGALFRSTEFQKGETELLIVVTPRLVAPIKPSQVKLPTDRVADPDAAKSVLFGESYDPVPATELAAPSQATTAPVVPQGDDYEY